MSRQFLSPRSFERNKLICQRDKIDPANFFDGGSSELVFWSFRYFLGRMTISTCAFADSLARAWHSLDEKDQKLIKKELEEAFEKDDEARSDPNCNFYPLGHDCDRQAWEGVRKAYQ